MTFFALPPSSLQDFCKNAQWRAHPLLQDFCKKAQWRAKKLRERGSNTARPTEKGGGGLPIRSRFGRDLQTSSWRFVPIRSVSARRFVPIRSISSRFADFILAFRADSVDFVTSCRADSVDFVAICRLHLGVSCRFGRFRRVVPIRALPKSRRKHKKSPIPQSGDRAQLSQGVARS